MNIFGQLIRAWRDRNGKASIPVAKHFVGDDSREYDLAFAATDIQPALYTCVQDSTKILYTVERNTFTPWEGKL